MGSRSDTGGRLPAETRSGAGHGAPAEAPGGPPLESLVDQDGGSHEAALDTAHVTLKSAELQRLLHPQAAEI
jgi:hypothetical protein